MRTQTEHRRCKDHPREGTRCLIEMLVSSKSLNALRLTRRGLSEQHEQANAQEDRDDGASDLSDELVLWLCTQKMTSLQVTGHVACLSGRACSNDTSDQVDFLSSLELGAGTLGNTTKDELGGLGDSGHGVDISVARGLNTNEGENETEDYAPKLE